MRAAISITPVTWAASWRLTGASGDGGGAALAASMMATWPEEARRRSRIADKNDTEITLEKALGMWDRFCLNFSPCTLIMHRWGTGFPFGAGARVLCNERDFSRGAGVAQLVAQRSCKP